MGLFSDLRDREAMIEVDLELAWIAFLIELMEVIALIGATAPITYENAKNYKERLNNVFYGLKDHSMELEKYFYGYHLEQRYRRRYDERIKEKYNARRFL